MKIHTFYVIVFIPSLKVVLQLQETDRYLWIRELVAVARV